MEYLIFIGIVLVIIYGYHFIRYLIGDYRDVDHYINEEVGDFLISLTSLIFAISIVLAGIVVVFLGGCVIRYLFM